MKSITITLLSLFISVLATSQKTEYPVIGAQVFIEPGQTKAQIENYFKVMHENNMEICRIRMFENHMHKPDNTWDFEIYDIAFNAAEKNNIKIFATLFPTVDFGNVSGFKYPSSEEHLKRVSNYIETLVNHYKNHKALYCWVLINEPGTDEPPLDRPFIQELYKQWKDTYKKTDYNIAYRKDDFDKYYFLRFLNTWYIKWLSDKVKKYDPKTYQHVNPHGIYDLLPTYNLEPWQDFLSSLGASMHPSWHFNMFNRKDFPLAMAANNDIIREASGIKPYWVTELQGGNTIFSPNKVLCGTKEEYAQWLWTSFTCGAEGIIFWSLNSRATGIEGGEWALLNYQDKPSDRMLISGQIAQTIIDNKTILYNIEPVNSGITILYSPDAFWQQRSLLYSWLRNDASEFRKPQAIIKSILGFYKALAGLGIQANIVDINAYDFSNPEGQVIIIPNQIAIASKHWQHIDDFVKNGGRILFTGLSGYFDEYRHNVQNINFPFKELMGCEMEEYKHIADSHEITINGITLPAHSQLGIIHNINAEPIGKQKENIIAIHHNYGKGEVIWIPSPIGLGAWEFGTSQLASLLNQEYNSNLENIPIKFNEYSNSVLMRVAKLNDGNLVSLINKNTETANIYLKGNGVTDNSRILFQLNTNSTIKGNKVSLEPEECMVIYFP